MVSIQQYIATINPEEYYDSKGDAKALEEFKDLIKEVGPAKAAKKAKVKAESSQTIMYDSAAEGLEPVYFFLLDLMNDFRLKPEKLYDSFSSSEGGGHFGDMGTRKSVMQQQGTKLLADINTVLRSVLNLIYDLREFKIKLQSYTDLNNKNKFKSEAALLSLKQVWMDKVDMQKGAGSINQMAQQLSFVTLRDAFLAANNIQDVNKLDLNEIVKRVVKQRFSEFEGWLKHSESELRKRFEIEKTYLKSQVKSLRLYSKWAKPYLKAAQTLEMEERPRDAALVKAFNTLILELTLMGKHKLDAKELAQEGTFPSHFKALKIRRDYYSCILVDFKFRSIPQKVQGQTHYAFGGRVDFTLNAYSLNQEELDKLDALLKEEELGGALGLIEGTTTESLEQLKEDINYFIGDDEEEEEVKKKPESINPFKALIGGYNEKSKPKKKEEKKEEKEIKAKDMIIEGDNWYEKDYLRKQASSASKDTAFTLFDVYKKAHGMASYT